MKYYLWKFRQNNDDYSIFAIAESLEEAQKTAIRNSTRACREDVRTAVLASPTIIKGPYAFLVKAKVDFDCKPE